MKNKPLKSFLTEIAEIIEQEEQIRSQEMPVLIDRWKKLLEGLRQPGRSPAEEYRQWYHLKLSIEWIKEVFIIEKKSLLRMC
nr:hypothetical protein [uncultured Draconibacterium sp.]